MSKKNRAKSKAKRFGEGSAKPIVSAATYGVGGNAFAQAIADPVSTVHSNKPELLVVDGYNVIHCTPRYEKLVYDHSDDPYSSDVHDMARTALINDVAAFAQGRYEAVIVFDGAGNISNERPNLPARGVRIEFSPTGVSADTVVQKLCIEAREEGRACSVVSSDGTIQAVVMGKGVTRVSSRMLVDEIKQIAKEHTGFIKTMWCGDLACEMKMKEEVGLSSRCMPFEQEHLSDVCPCCGKPAKTMVYWGVAY